MNDKKTKVIILDNNPLSIACYFDEFPEMEKKFNKKCRGEKQWIKKNLRKYLEGCIKI